jgi:hypothetical protein
VGGIPGVDLFHDSAGVGDHTPIGTAMCICVSTGRRASWKLIVHEAEMSGHWVVIDRAVRPERGSFRGPRRLTMFRTFRPS